MANHGTKIRRYMEKYGQDAVENFVDRVLSLENLIDVNYLFETPDAKTRRTELNKQAVKESDRDFLNDDRSDALISFLRTKDRREKEKQDKTDKPDTSSDIGARKVPKSPMKDILLFLVQHAPIEEWQADVIGILREEAYYFLPQRMTKIMNEGWASYWHSKIMTERALDASEIVDFADKHAGVMAMSKKNINPYKVGIELFRDLEYRWNTGKFGKEYNECDDLQAKENWNLNLNQGRAKIFEVRKSHNDITFIDEYLTPEFCDRQQLFTYKFNPRTGRFEIDSRDFQAIKQKLLLALTNFGSPVIEVVDANYSNRSELLLNHKHYGVDLDVQYATDTMRNLFAIWKRPINLATKYDEKQVVFHFDGKELKTLS
jgi:stage V sporulation protein R